MSTSFRFIVRHNLHIVVNRFVCDENKTKAGRLNTTFHNPLHARGALSATMHKLNIQFTHF